MINEEKRPMIFSVPLDIAKQKQNNINECLLCNRRNFKMKTIKKIIPVLLILLFVVSLFMIITANKEPKSEGIANQMKK